jgi:uncharacterized protein (TIGR01777 family)
MLGTAITRALRKRGDRVVSLVRREPVSEDEVRWDPTSAGAGIGAQNRSKLESLNGVVHLSGANVSEKRWTAAFKQEIEASRMDSTRAMAGLLTGLNSPPSVFVSASAIGFYGNRGDEILTEDAAKGAGFFPRVCAEWEHSANAATDAGIRVVHPRFGVVLGAKGGAMDRLAPLFRLGLGGRLGNGRQWMSWVDEVDAVEAVVFALDTETLKGPLNVTAPSPIDNSGFTKELAHALHRPALIPAPAFALRLAFGQMADEALLASTRAVPEKLLNAGFQFQSPTLAECLARIFDRKETA